MKKWYLSLAFIIIFSLTACGGGSGSSSKDSSSVSADNSSGVEVSGEVSTGSESGTPEPGSSSNSETSGGVSEAPAKSLAELGWKEVADFDIGFCLPPVDGMKQQERYVANGEGPLFQVSYYFETGNYMEDFSADGVPQKSLVSIVQNKVDYACTQDNIGIGGPGFLSGFQKWGSEETVRTSYELYSEADGLYVYRATGGPGADGRRGLLLFKEGDTAYYTITTSNSAFDAGYFTDETYGMFIGSLKYLGWGKDAEALPGWKVAYLKYVKDINTGWGTYYLKDINNDGIPELFGSANGDCMMWYFDKAGVLHNLWRMLGLSYSGDTLKWSNRVHGVSLSAGLMTYNRDTGIYESTLDVEENFMTSPTRYTVNGDEVDEGQYNAALENMRNEEDKSIYDIENKGTSCVQLIKDY